jgi:type II secretory pathway component GspD/PulD (secretin)
LMEDRKTETVDKFPILGDIPGLGELFKRRQNSKTKTELLIFLTPHVATQPEQLQSMSNDELQGTKLVPNAVSPGTFEQQRQGMGRGEPSEPSRGNHDAPSQDKVHENAPTTQPQ